MDAQVENAVDTLALTIAEAGMQAVARILRNRGLTSKDVDLEKITVELRKELRDAGQNVLDQGQALVDGGMSGWLQTLVMTEATEAAQRALITCGVLPGKKVD